MLKESFPPVVGEKPVILVLGSLPGDESLRQQQYYAYKYNAFWPILGEVFNFDPTLAYAERLRQLTDNKIALWDVVAAGRRPGSLDGNLTAGNFNDIAGLLVRHSSIRRIGCNGSASYNFLKRGFKELFRSDLYIVRLPSTSPAAAAIRYTDKLAAWRKFLTE